MTNEEITYDIFRRCLSATATKYQPQGAVNEATRLTKLALERLQEFGIVKPAGLTKHEENMLDAAWGEPKDQASLISEIIHAVYGIEISQTLAEQFIKQKDIFFHNRNLYRFTLAGFDLLKLYANITGQGFKRPVTVHGADRPVN